MLRVFSDICYVCKADDLASAIRNDKVNCTKLIQAKNVVLTAGESRLEGDLLLKSLKDKFVFQM